MYLSCIEIKYGCVDDMKADCIDMKLRRTFWLIYTREQHCVYSIFVFVELMEAWMALVASRSFLKNTLITRSMGPTWGPSGADRTQVGPMLAPWILLSGYWPGTFSFRGKNVCARLYQNILFQIHLMMTFWVQHSDVNFAVIQKRLNCFARGGGNCARVGGNRCPSIFEGLSVSTCKQICHYFDGLVSPLWNYQWRIYIFLLLEIVLYQIVFGKICCRRATIQDKSGGDHS